MTDYQKTVRWLKSLGIHGKVDISTNTTSGESTISIPDELMISYGGVSIDFKDGKLLGFDAFD